MGLGSTKVIHCLTGANYLDPEHQSKTLSEFLKIIKLFVCNLVLLLPTYTVCYCLLQISHNMWENVLLGGGLLSSL